MRLQKAEHPNNSRDLTNVFDFGTGRKIRSDAHGEVACQGRRQTGAMLQKNKFLNGLKKAPWRRHQSVAHSSKGRCQYVDCPGRKASKAKVPRPYDTHMRCEECSIALGKDIYICNSYKGGKLCLCHKVYHEKYHNEKYARKQTWFDLSLYVLQQFFSKHNETLKDILTGIVFCVFFICLSAYSFINNARHGIGSILCWIRLNWHVYWNIYLFCTDSYVGYQ